MAKASPKHGRLTLLLPTPPWPLPEQATSELYSSWPAGRRNIRRARWRRGLSTQQHHVGEDNDILSLSVPLRAPGARGGHHRHCSGTPCAAGCCCRATRRRCSSHAAGSDGSPCAGRCSRRSTRCRRGESQLQQDHGAKPFCWITFKQLHSGDFLQSSTPQAMLLAGMPLQVTDFAPYRFARAHRLSFSARLDSKLRKC